MEVITTTIMEVINLNYNGRLMSVRITIMEALGTTIMEVNLQQLSVSTTSQEDWEQFELFHVP